MALNELDFVGWLRENCAAHPAVELGIGDDMALLSPRSNRILVASDMLLDGVHFDSKRHSMEAIGRKAVARNLSDCAAMAVRPVAVTISVAFSRDTTESGAHALLGGMMSIASEFDLAIAGGDTALWKNPLAIDVAVLAEPYEGVAPVLRSGAVAGDRMYVTGALGGSLLGRHMDFTPRVAEGRELARFLKDRLHAMIDISDGLSLDLWRVCKASGVGAQLDTERVLAVASEDAKRAAKSDGAPLLDHVLGDGEDYELLIAVAGEVAGTPAALLPIGVITTAKELRLADRNGKSTTIEPRGFRHG